MVCEHCGFSFTEDFTRYFAPGVQDDIRRQITEKWVHHDFKGERTVFQAIQAYKLAFLCGTIKKRKIRCNSRSCIASCMAVSFAKKNEGQEQRFMKISRDHYMESYSTEDYSSTQMSDVRIMYMIAELSRRIGDLENATRFFSRVIEKQSTGGEAKVIDMAKEQWAVIRKEKEQARQV